LMTRPAVAAPIASATNLDQLSEMIASVNITLTLADIEQLNEASD
jgi:aryl-alcohol dehydrogenase-like predicted oxidoreductase